MAENNMDGVADIQGGVDKPVHDASGTANVDYVRALQELQVQVKNLSKDVNAMKSGKDRGVNRAMEKLDNLQAALDRYAEYLETYKDPKRAKREIQIDALLERYASEETDNEPVQQTQGYGKPAVSAPATSTAHAALINAMGLNENSPEVIAAVREFGDDIPALVISLAEIVKDNAKKQSSQQSPNPARQMPVAGGAGADVTTDSLMKEYQAMTANIPLGEAGVRGRHQAKLAIRKKAKEAGIASPV